MTGSATAFDGELLGGSAEQAIESLRKGLPPSGMVRRFTVGRENELDELERSLARPLGSRGAALLVRANYGAGKTHLLQVTREMAMEAGYAVSLVTLDAQGGVRFNRMDQVLGAVCRSIEVPGDVRRGVGSLFRRYLAAEATVGADVRQTRERISDQSRWDFSEALLSPPMFVALRAWVTAAEGSDIRELVEDWLAFPPNFRTQRADLYRRLVVFPGRPFRDPRREDSFFREDVLEFHKQGYAAAWSALADLDLIARCSGLKGLVILFDEFEDVVQNLNNRAHQQQAFLNLFRFFAGDKFPGMAYFAVTPEFVVKCKRELTERLVYDFPFERFDELPHFEMSPIDRAEFRLLAERIRRLHGIAYEWDASAEINDDALDGLVAGLYSNSTADRVRQAVEGLISELDDAFERADA